MYKALYRKYRPLSLKDLVGQPFINQTLINTIKSNNIGHSYLFSGPRGTGKTSTARIFSKLVNCLNPIDGVACENCENCRLINNNETSDIIEIDAASNNGVEEIRELRSKVNLITTNLKYKIYIIDEVHMLSTGAFNALLKTLEEPPLHVIFILATTDLYKVPGTIISRCQTFSFSKIQLDDIANRLEYICQCEKIDANKQVLMEIARLSDGALRDAIGILDKLTTYSENKLVVEDVEKFIGIISKVSVNKFIDNIITCNYKEILESITNFASEGKDFSRILTDIIFELRDRIVDIYINKSNFNKENYLKLINELCKLDNDLKMSSNIKILFETRILELSDTIFEKSVQKIEVINESININNKKEEIVKSPNDHIDLDEKIENKLDKELNQITEGPPVHIVEEVVNEKVLELNDLGYIPENSLIKTNLKLKNIRINNTFCKASKEILNDYKKRWKKLNDLILDNEFGSLVHVIIDGNLRAASEENLIISFPYNSLVERIDMKIDSYSVIAEKILEHPIKLICITEEEWETKKAEFIKNKKNNVKLELIKEIVENDISEDNTTQFSEKTKLAIDLFGNDVVVVEGEKI
ncbi:MAG: DNA polymerase III subunit gamma/tau [Bacilli bacterium]